VFDEPLLVYIDGVATGDFHCIILLFSHPFFVIYQHSSQDRTFSIFLSYVTNPISNGKKAQHRIGSKYIIPIHKT
jgi:hypothetical protein